jgi:hypothetical protein
MAAGMREDEAQEKCAIIYYKKYGMTPQQAEKAEKAETKKLGVGDLFKFAAPFQPTFVKNENGEDECVVEGYATTEALDSQMQVVDKLASFEAIDEWAKIGNVREMHQPSAVGKKLWIEKRDKGPYVGVKVVDPIAKMKVREGVYTMFSIGGKILKIEGNKITKYKMTELSLVDRGANPETPFIIVKVDDATNVATGDIMEENKESPPEKQAATQSQTGDMIAKAEYEKVEADLKKAQARIAELEKIESERKKEDDVKAMIAKAISELGPEIKKGFEEKPQMDQKELMKESLKKMSIGELTVQMMKLQEAKEV